MTPALRQFLADWLAWAEAGAPEHPVFHRRGGLCVLASRVSYYLNSELEDVFDEIFYPFGGYEEYHRRRIDETQHENPARRAWVRQQLGVEG